MRRNKRPVTITASNIADFLTCEKKYFWSQVDGKRKKRYGEIPRNVGEIVHLGFEVWRKEGKNAAVRAIKDRTGELFTQGYTRDGFDPDKLEILETTSIAMVENMPWELPDEVEREFCVPAERLGLDNIPFNLAGKIDGVARDKRGKPVLREYKTKGDISKAIKPVSLDTNLQASFYFYVAQRALGLGSLRGVEFCFVRRPSIRQRKDETIKAFLYRLTKDYEKRPNFYYIEALTYRDPEDATFMLALRAILERIIYCLSNGTWLSNFTQCEGLTYTCPYVGLCHQEYYEPDAYEDVGPDHHPELSEFTIEAGNQQNKS